MSKLNYIKQNQSCFAIILRHNLNRSIKKNQKYTISYKKFQFLSE